MTERISERIRKYVVGKARIGAGEYMFSESGGFLNIGVSNEEGEWIVWRCKILAQREGFEKPPKRRKDA